jgi:hypothetical protein
MGVTTATYESKTYSVLTVKYLHYINVSYLIIYNAEMEAMPFSGGSNTK